MSIYGVGTCNLAHKMAKGNTPIVAESLGMNGAQMVVAVDNYQAALALGRWTGEYALRHFGGQAHILDLTFQLENTRARSHGFLDGVRSVLPTAELALRFNAQSTRRTAYQLALDALAVHPDINVDVGRLLQSGSGDVSGDRRSGLRRGCHRSL